MAIVSSAVTTAIMTAGAPNLNGPTWGAVAGAVGNAVGQWVKTGGIQAQGLVVGTAGGGLVNGKMQCMVMPLPGTLQGVGLLGLSAAKMGNAIGLGFCDAFNASATYVGGSAIATNGADASKVVFANAGSLIGLLTNNLGALGIVGLQAGTLAAGIGNGIAAIAMTGVGVGGSVGTPAPMAAMGTSKTVVV